MAGARVWGAAAAGWSLLFATAHLYWAAGGSLGLAESAGAALATQRPDWFVVVGLYGVAALLGATAVLGLLLRDGSGPGWRRLLRPLGAAVCVVLLLRGAVLELVLLVDPAYGNGAVSSAERSWSLVLWNPWFVLGGVLFGLATVATRRRAPPAAS